MSAKYIFVTGGVVSGLGKGITAASLGRLLKQRGYKVTIQKFDLKVVSEHLGHCDVNVTADIYADVLRKTKARTAEQIELCLA